MTAFVCLAVCKKAKKKESAKFDTLSARHFDVYLKLPAEAPVNPKEKTEQLFREVLF